MNLCTTTTASETSSPLRRSIVPRYQVRDTQEAFIVTAQVPGVDRSALTTEVKDDKLTVEGRRTWQAPEEWRPVSLETSSLDYRLVIEIDHRINREAIRAQLNQGVLTLTLPKAESVKPRRIEIAG